METHIRSVVKAVSWRLTGSLDTLIISWIVTGSIGMATSITVIEIVTKIVYYWIHERVWDQIKWGRQ